MSRIIRQGHSPRWSDVVIHGGTAHWIEVAEDLSLDARGQVEQVLAQIDATLAQVGGDRTRLIQVLVYLSPEVVQAALDEPWEAWVPAGHAPVRATVRVGLAAGCLVEMVVTAASSLDDPRAVGGPYASGETAADQPGDACRDEGGPEAAHERGGGRSRSPRLGR